MIDEFILVRIIGNKCYYGSCQESSKYYFKLDVDIYLCERHFNMIQQKNLFKVIINEFTLNKFNIDSRLGIKYLVTNFLAQIKTKPKVNPNWTGNTQRQGQKNIEIQKSQREIELIISGDIEQLKAFYKANPNL